MDKHSHGVAVRTMRLTDTETQKLFSAPVQQNPLVYCEIMGKVARFKTGLTPSNLTKRHDAYRVVRHGILCSSKAAGFIPKITHVLRVVS